MRTFEILDRSWMVVAVHELEDSMAPALLEGFTARIIAVNGVRVEPGAEPDHPEHLPSVEGEEAAPAPVDGRDGQKAE
jgi:hypothetical protein